MFYPGLQDNSAVVGAYYREHCDPFRVQGDVYEKFIQAMKAKGTRGERSLTKFVGGVGQLWATDDRVAIVGYDGSSENEKGKFTSSCHISRDGYAFQVDTSNTSRPAHSEAERDEVVTRFRTATEKLLAA